MLTNRECLFHENPTFVQGVSPFVQKLTENVRTKETTSWLVIKKVKVAYRSFRIRELKSQSLSHSSNGISRHWSQLELFSNRNCYKESFDCIKCLEQCVFLDSKP